MPVMDFLTIRFVIASIAMIIFRPSSLRNISRSGLLRGVILGLLLGLSYITQTYGLLSASATVVGFLTGMFVVFTPAVSWFWIHQKVQPITWFSVFLAALGLALLSLHGWSIGIGELLTLVCAISLAFYVVGLGKWSPQHEPYSFSLVQLTSIAVVLLLLSLPGGISIPPDTGVWITVGITSILATALAFFVQTWAQSLLSPTHAAVIMTMEPVFAVIFAIAIGNEPLTLRIVGGAFLILCAMLIVQFKRIPISSR